MSYAASHSIDPHLTSAARAVCADVRKQLNGQTPDLSFVFVSHAHADDFEALPALLRQQLDSKVLLGCTGQTVVGGGEEIEDGPALSLWSAVLPGAELLPFHLQFGETPDGLIAIGFPNDLQDRAADARAVFMLGEPFTSVPDSVIERLAEELPGVPLFGGMASGGSPGANRVFLNDECLEHGAVAVLLRGGPKVRSVVSQGCRPIGPTFVVTKAERNIVFELGGKPTIERVREFLPSLPGRDQRLVQSGLHLGIAMSELKRTFQRGDFLIANVIGADQELGAIAIGNVVRTGQTVQFHVRDADTADEDFIHMLEASRAERAPATRAALLFSCNGRGTRLFSEPHHDARTIRRLLGSIPLAGFFAQGELGP
ncbi:MAG TPA: FIST N-terminal domain-containing protein, partial [Planctomycetaceae bacterium]|nr:FIST N-terminal domain-containing protein [Planctomycetaceae bacterium]